MAVVVAPVLRFLDVGFNASVRIQVSSALLDIQTSFPGT